MRVVLPVQNDGGFRRYSSHVNRKRAITQLRNSGWNYFVTYRATTSTDPEDKDMFGLSFGKADGLSPDTVNVN